MAIYFVTGRPGAGKGLYAMKLIESELRDSNRKIVTNFPLLLDKLAQQCHDVYGQSFDILSRIHLIESKHEIANFFRIRGQHHEKESDWLTEEIDKKGRQIGYDIEGAFKGGGVMYLLDEVHLVFGARDWQQIGKAVIEYSSQHRKLSDTLYLISQTPNSVESSVRNIAQSFVVLRNFGLEKMGWFKTPNVFTAKTYTNLPKDGSKQEAQETTRFRLSIAWADCYETARGVAMPNIEGAPADKGEDRRSGVRWYWLLLGIVVLGGGAFWGVTKGIGYFFGKASESIGVLGGDGKSESNATADGNSTLDRVRAVLARRLTVTNAEPPRGQAFSAPPGEGEKVDAGVRAVIVTNFVEGFSFTRYRGKISAHFMLTSGRIIESGDGSVIEISKKLIRESDGSIYKFRPGVRFDPRELMQQP